jgi:hypothetical protein
VTLVKPLGAIHIPNVEMPWQAMREEKKAPPSPVHSYRAVPSGGPRIDRDEVSSGTGDVEYLIDLKGKCGRKDLVIPLPSRLFSS